MDEIDQQILFILQENARNNTNAQISEHVGVSPSTVGKRLKQLEAAGIINGYHPDINYERADLPLRVLFICSTSIPERSDLIDRACAVPGVITVKELMTGQHNVHIEVVGMSNDDVTRLATTIGNIGFDISEEILVKNEIRQPASVFENDVDE